MAVLISEKRADKNWILMSKPDIVVIIYCYFGTDVNNLQETQKKQRIIKDFNEFRHDYSGFFVYLQID